MEIKLEDKDFKCMPSSYSIMTINMNVKKPDKNTPTPPQAKRMELVISTIKNFPASVFFCQEVPVTLEEEVVKNFGPGVYEFAFTDKEAAVMWRRSEFEGDRQFLKGTDSLRIKTTEKLERKKSDVDASEVRTRTAMVKLTSVKTGASFLAVSWHGKWYKVSEPTKSAALDGLICFLCEVCKNNRLSSCIIGGDFNLNTKRVRPAKQEGATISISYYELCARDENRKNERKRGRGFTPFKDTFIAVSVTLPSGERLMTGDITVSLERQLEPKNESSDNKLMDHVPVVGVLKLVWPNKKPAYIEEDRDNEENYTTDEKRRDTVTEDTSKSRTTNEKDVPKYTPEKTMDTAEMASGDSSVRRKLFEDDHASHSESILDRNLESLGLHRIRVRGDGNCFFTAVACQLHQLMSTTDVPAPVSNSLSSIGITTNVTIPHDQLASLLRELVVKEWCSDRIDNYKEFVLDSVDFLEEVKQFQQSGYHQGPLGDLMPMAMANVLHMPLAIVRSESCSWLRPVDPFGSPITDVPLFLAYNSSGAGHYDGTVLATKNDSSGVHMIRSMEVPTGAEKYPIIMTINMKCKVKGDADDKKDLIISTINGSSVIFCQEAPGKFKNGLVAKCGNDPSSYNFVPKDIHVREKHEVKVAVMWREADFEGNEVDLTEPTITKVKERLKHKNSVADVTSMAQVSMERSAMVKLTSKGTTGASFLAVSWHGPEKVDEAEASKEFYGLICFVREVCENEKLSWFIIGGYLDFDTSKVHLTEVEGVTISYGSSVVPSRGIFVSSVPSVNKLPSTEDITVSKVKPLVLKNESNKNAQLKHVPVVGVLNLGQGKASTSDYVTREDFKRLFSLVEQIDAKINTLTAEVEKIKLAMKPIDGPQGSVSQAQPTEPHS